MQGIGPPGQDLSNPGVDDARRFNKYGFTGQHKIAINLLEMRRVDTIYNVLP